MSWFPPCVASPTQVFYDGPEIDVSAAYGTKRYPQVLERWHRFRANLEERLRDQLRVETEIGTTLTRWDGRITRYEAGQGWGYLEDVTGAHYNFNVNALVKDEAYGREGLARGMMVKFTPLTGPRGPWAAAVVRLPPPGSLKRFPEPARASEVPVSPAAERSESLQRKSLPARGVAMIRDSPAAEQEESTGNRPPAVSARGRLNRIIRESCVGVMGTQRPQRQPKVVSHTPEGVKSVVVEPERGVRWSELMWSGKDDSEEESGEAMIDRRVLAERLSVGSSERVKVSASTVAVQEVRSRGRPLREKLVSQSTEEKPAAGGAEECAGAPTADECQPTLDVSSYEEFPPFVKRAEFSLKLKTD